MVNENYFVVRHPNINRSGIESIFFSTVAVTRDITLGDLNDLFT
jgi:hypothetical protein